MAILYFGILIIISEVKDFLIGGKHIAVCSQ